MDTRRRSTREQIHSLALAVLRVGTGVIMIAHGWQKVTGFSEWQRNVDGLGVPFPDIAAVLAVVGELGGGIGLVLGLLTPLAALGVLAVMVTAIATVHAENGLFAADNGFEFPLLIALVTLFFVARGAGRYSVDALIRRRAGRP